VLASLKRQRPLESGHQIVTLINAGIFAWAKAVRSGLSCYLGERRAHCNALRPRPALDLIALKTGS
jgi:hypothetical protein